MRLISVVSARELSAAEKLKVEKVFSAKLSEEVQADYAVDESLLGGITVTAGDMVFDGSLSSEIVKLGRILEQKLLK